MEATAHAAPAGTEVHAAAPKRSWLFTRPIAKTGIVSWLTTVDHKRIGMMYGIAALFFFLVGGVEALMIRIQLAVPNNTFISHQTYNEMFTMHATTMIFLSVMPLSAAFFNYIMPLQIGARDVAFPRLNGFAFWVFLVGAIILNIGWFVKSGAPDAGWFGYEFHRYHHQHACAGHDDDAPAGFHLDDALHRVPDHPLLPRHHHRACRTDDGPLLQQ